MMKSNVAKIKGFGVTNMCPFWPVVLCIVLLAHCACVCRSHARTHISVGLYMAPQERMKQIEGRIPGPQE